MDREEREENMENGEKDNVGSLSIEQIFETKGVPSWQEQLTFRAFFVSLVLSFFFCFIVMKLNLTTGIIPSLNVAAGLLGFFFVKTWTTVLEKSGLLKQPFTRQENTVIQTCIVASSGIAFSGGFGSYLFGMSEKIASQSEENTPVNVKNPSLKWMMGFLFAVSFVGLFSVVPLRKIMITKLKLIYPSGTATASLINSFHTPKGTKLVKKQVSALFKTFSCSFIWAFFQWFFTGGDDCGFTSFPTFGLQAYAQRFYFDFSATYVGVGMLCPYIVNVSLLLGSVISWGMLWPYIETKKGDWYPTGLKPSDLHGLQGYKVFIGIAIILGDGLFNFLMVLAITIFNLSKTLTKKDSESVIPVADRSSPDNSVTFDEKRRTELFLRDQIPTWVAIGGYVVLATISTIVVPLTIFPQLKWYHMLVTYLIAPILAFCNAYGCGLTDWSLASSYGKIAIFIFGAWVGMAHGGVLAGLAACGVMMSIVSTASDLMQDFKTGYLTLASPRSMFVSQVIGTAMGCIISPCVFWIFYKAFPIGDSKGAYPAPYANVYRGIALLGVEGTSALPKNCLSFCLAAFLIAIAISALKELLKHWNISFHRFVPSAMAMAIPFYIGSYFSIDMCLGSLILFIWRKRNKPHAEAFYSAIASGMICGDGIWALPAAILSVAKVNPPICMKFLSSATNVKVDNFLNS
ncbi:putative metal-nicotianamine transporter YSL7 [Tasmannia lanceolata]|uniref:putative metal-nicotianamine transporter YSL7 n=1 Tax=Tasmannia lanceolata TaxID=3420 RepID=UPI0040648A24